MLDKVADNMFVLLRLGIGVGLVSDDEVSSLNLMTETDMSSMLVLEDTNLQQLAVMNQLANVWIESGCKVMVMKCQANALMYTNPLHRSSGICLVIM